MALSNSLNPSFIGNVGVQSSTDVPVGGTTGVGLTMSTTPNLGVFFGSGAPTLTAAQGSLYLNTAGSGIADRLYVNTTGAAIWTNVATAV